MKRQQLLVRAEQSGTWIAPIIHHFQGAWLNRGKPLGKINSHKGFTFTAVVSQEEAANLFTEQFSGKAAIRLAGQAGTDLPVKTYHIIPFQHERLPSAALGWNAGGDIPVSSQDKDGLHAIEPFFQIYADIDLDGIQTDKLVLNHGHSGKIRFHLHPEPLLGRLFRKVRQFFQKRYQV